MMNSLPGIACFLVSALLLAWTSWAMAAGTARDKGERFWIFLAAAAMCLGSVATLASLAGVLAPAGWLLVQALLSLALHLALRSWKRIGGGSAPASGQALSPGPGRLPDASTPALPRHGWLFCLILLIALSAALQIMTPVSGFDDRMYHASRVAYWMQNGSVLPFETHNDRQTVFSFGSELFFLWPLLFTKLEWLGRLVFWLAFPCAAMGLRRVILEAGGSGGLAWAGAALFLGTPLVFEQAVGLSPEIWLSLFVLGVAFWVLRARKNPADAPRCLFLAALWAAMAAGVKFTVLPAFLFLAGVPILLRLKRKRIALVALAGGALAGVLTSGLAVTLACNVIHFSHPLGPRGLRRVVQSDLGWRQIYVHSVRFPFLLAELPAIPFSGVRHWLERKGNKVAALLGADALLPLEENPGWPGRFAFNVRPLGQRFSLGGLLWLPVLGGALWVVLREARRSGPAPPSSLCLLLLMEILTLASVLYLVRWQSASGLPERFLVGPFALMVVVGALFSARFSFRRRLVPALVSIGLLVVVAATLAHGARAIGRLAATPADGRTDEPFTTALRRIAPGARILLVASQDARDYGLFLPRAGFVNRVFPWGKRPFDGKRMRSLIRDKDITHILVQNDRAVSFQWNPPQETVTLCAWLAVQADLQEIPLDEPGTRLFARKSP